MKYFLSLVVSFSVLCTSVSAVEYGILSLNSNYDNFIVLEEGDILDILTSYSTVSGGNSAMILGVFYETDNSLLLTNLHGNNLYNNIEGNILWREDLAYTNNAVRTLAGPMKVFITKTSNYSPIASLSYRLSKASEVEYKNVNIISLPSSTVGAGTHEIVVEASDDLQSWTPVHSSSIGGNKAFFRTRVTEIGD